MGVFGFSIGVLETEVFLKTEQIFPATAFLRKPLPKEELSKSLFER